MTSQATLAAENDCSGAGLLRAEVAAVELYRLAALMLGSEAAALRLVEKTISQFEVDPCGQEEAAAELVRRQLIQGAIAEMAEADPAAFAAPVLAFGAQPACIEEDDLSSAGISPAQLSELVNGAGRGELRQWLERLPLAQRAIFVQRAVLGWDNGTAAESLNHASGGGWQPQLAGETFRHALCSLATSMVHSAAMHRASA
jgi:hypothetical protein